MSWRTKLVSVERTLGSIESRGRRLAEIELLRPYFQAAMALSMVGNTFTWAEAALDDGRVGGDGPFAGALVESAYCCFAVASSPADGLNRLQRVKEIEDAWCPQATRPKRKPRAGKARRKKGR